MQVAVLGSSDSWYVADLVRAAKSRSVTIERCDFPSIAARVADQSEVKLQHSPARPDAVIVRSMPPGSLEQVIFRMDALAEFEAAGGLVVNSPKSLECAIDKYLSLSRMARAGLPVPPTIACECADSAMEAFVELGGDIVLKPLFGSEGRGVIRITDSEIAWRTFRAIARIDSVLYLQKFIENPGYDTRILLLDGICLGAIRRHAQGDFRANVAQQATAEPHEPTDYELQLARRAAEITRTHFAGVDLLGGSDGKTFVVEVNAVPGWRALAQATQVDVAGRFLDWIRERAT